MAPDRVGAGQRLGRAGVAALLVALALLSGCDLFPGSDSDKPKVQGKRISVLALEKQLEPDPAVADLTVALPPPAVNPSWPQAGGVPSHVMGHPALATAPATLWTANVGEGTSRYAQMLASPVVVGDTVYTMDSTSLISAWDGAGVKLWETDISPDEVENQAWGGGIAYDDGRIYVTSGFAQVLALDAKDGHVIWRVSVAAPVHGAPTVANGRIFFMTVDDALLVISATDGHPLWNYEGVPESAVLSGTPSPAVSGEVVVVPFASGDLVAMRADNGRVIWTDNLAATTRFDAISNLADIRGRPVIDGDRVFAVSHSGRMVSIDLRTGERAWEQDLAGVTQPWVVGGFVYVLSTGGEVLCLTRDEGRIRWITQLDRYEDPDDKTSKPITWTGPLLAGDRLILVASNGQAWSLSPYTGKPLGKIEIPDASFLAPVVADKTLYLMTAGADLLALK